MILNSSMISQETLDVFSFQEMPFTTVLTKLERIYDVKFSYNSEWFENYKINLASKEKNIEKVLEVLQNQIHFSYKKIDKRYFVLKQLSKINICGYIKEESTNEFIYGVNIYNTTKTKTTSSNIHGYFKLSDVDLNDTISLSSLGFRTTKIPVRTFYRKCKKINLTEQHQQLNEVIVKEYLSSGISLKNNGTINFNLKEADILAGQAEPDILQTIQLLPGVESTTENASDLFIRGGTPDQNLVLWDGIKLYNTDHFFGTLTNLNATIVDNVTIYKNGTNAKYGDRVSGVIDIDLGDQVPEKIQTSVGVNFLFGDLSIKTPISKKLGLIVSARRSFTDLFETSIFENNFSRIFQNSKVLITKDIFDTEPDLLQKQSLFFEDYSAKLIYDISAIHKFLTTFLYTNNKFEDQFEAALRSPRTNLRSTLIFFDDLKIENKGISSSLISTWSEKMGSSLKFNYVDYDLNYNGIGLHPLFLAPIELERSNRIEEYNVSFDLNKKIKKNIIFAAGYNLSKKTIKSSIEESFSDVISKNNDLTPSHAIHGQITYNKSQKAHFDLGTRVNKFPTFNKFRFEPRFYGEIKLGSFFRVKTSAEQKYQATNRLTILSANDTGEENEVWLPSIKDSIPLLKSKQLSIGVLFKKKNWVVDIEAYYKELDGLSLFNESPTNILEPGKFPIPNTGNGIVKGVDVLVKKKFSNYSTWLGYTYAINKQRFNAINQGRFFNTDNDIRHSLTWSNSFEWKNFQCSLGWKYRTGTPFNVVTDFDSNLNAVVESYNEQRVPDYHKLDMSINYSLKLSKKETEKSMKLGVSVFNIYNQKNILDINTTRFFVFDVFSTEEPKLTEFRTESLGATANVFLRFNF